MDDHIITERGGRRCHRQLDEALPKLQRVGYANERLEEADRARGVLPAQIPLVLDKLLAIAILVESHHCNSRVLVYGDLDVDPLVEGQEDSVREGLLKVIPGIDVDAERGARIVPEGERLVKTNEMVVFAASRRVGVKRVLTKVLHPERHSVSYLATFVIETRNLDIAEGVASALVELRHLNVLLRYRVAERRSDILSDKLRVDSLPLGLLQAESIIVTVQQNSPLELVVAQGRVVHNLVLMHQVLHVGEGHVAKRHPELAVVPREAILARTTPVVSDELGDGEMGIQESHDIVILDVQANVGI